MPSDRHEYSDDLFADTRMSFGEHIEDLRAHLISAIKGTLFILVIGFVLDFTGWAIGKDWLGLGKPAMDLIIAPVKQQLIAFYDRRMEKLIASAEAGEADAQETLKPKPVTVTFPPEAVAKLLGKPAPAEDAEPVEVEVRMKPLDVYKATRAVNNFIRPPELSTLSVTEAMVVYFKVSIIVSLVIASPWVFWQIWSFIAAGLYPHEKKLVHVWLPISVALFLGGVAMCQFAIIPRSIEALLWFNEWMGLAPDLRLNEWLSFAIWLPVVFGLAFQTPLVMMVLERIGIMTVEGYLGYWRIAIFVMAVLAAVITPTPDAVTWFAMWAPMVGLYFLGIYLCKLSARRRPAAFDVPEADELIEV